MAQWNSPDGVSQFNIRGWQGRGRPYCADGLVLFCPGKLMPITTSTDGLEAGDIKIKVADGEMPGSFARPKAAGNALRAHCARAGNQEE